MAIHGVGHVSPGAEWRKVEFFETRQAVDLFQRERRPPRNIIPAEQQLAARAQTLVTFLKRGLAVFVLVEAPTKHAVADDEVEGLPSEVFAQVLERRRNVMSGPVLPVIGIRLDCNESHAAEKIPLVAR